MEAVIGGADNAKIGKQVVNDMRYTIAFVNTTPQIYSGELCRNGYCL